MNVKSVFGAGFANFLSHTDENGTRKLLGESISHSGYIIMVLQVFVSRIAEKFKALPTFILGLFVAAIGFNVLAFAKIASPTWVFLGIFLFAVGEMISSPRIQEYITWIAPKEKAGLYMGANFLATFIGATLSGIYTGLMGTFENLGHPEYIMFTLAVHILLGILAVFVFTKFAGVYKELEN